MLSQLLIAQDLVDFHQKKRRRIEQNADLTVLMEPLKAVAAVLKETSLEIKKINSVEEDGIHHYTENLKDKLRQLSAIERLRVQYKIDGLMLEIMEAKD